MKISLIQMNSVSDKAANIAAATKLIEQAVAEEQPDWIGLPECFDFLGGDRAAKMAAAETFPGGPAYGAMQALASKHNVYIHAGSILEKPEVRRTHSQHHRRLRPDRRGNRALSQNPYVRHHGAGRNRIS